MTEPESLPVEEARKKFADILDGTQHHSQHWQITRRGKRAGIVVPPEWYDRAAEALEATPTPPAPEESCAMADATIPICGARAVFWPDVEAIDAVCTLPRGHQPAEIHEDDALGEWDEDDLTTAYPESEES